MEKKNKNLIKKIKINNNKIKIFTGYYFLKNKKDFNFKQKYLAFCGIGNPNNFFDLLNHNRIKVKKNLIFPDHYDYTISDINRIKNIANENNLKIITTEKDFTKIKIFKNFDVKIAAIDLKIDRLKEFRSFLLN